VHLKDVDSTIASRVQSGRLSYSEGVKAGMYCSLGTGDVDIMAIVHYLQGHDYAGWYTLERDTVLTEPPRLGDGPIIDVRDSVELVRRLLFGEPRSAD
jgi:inosose dehydratase